MRRLLSVALLVTALLCGWIGCRRAAPAPRTLDVFFTCDVRGRLVPCGCFSGQLGGLTRIATMMRSLGREPTLKVDVGDALRGTADYEVIEYRYLLQAFSRLGYAALNLGQREAQLDAATLLALQRDSPVPMLSANLLDQKTGQPLFAPARTVTCGPHKIALVGVLDPTGLGESLGAGLAVEKMEVALSRLLPGLRKEVDAIVLLAFASEEAMKRLAAQFYEVDVILGGKVAQPSQQLIRENRSLILATTNESRALGVLNLEFTPPRKVQATAGEVRLVSDDIPEEAEIQGLARAYRDEVRRSRLAIDDPATLQQDMIPGVKATASYVGSGSCLSCHGTAAHAWQHSGHARAWEALVASGADADPSCIGCHAIGFGTPSGYRRELAGARLTGVGCESCHGPGSQHVAQQSAGGEATKHFRSLGPGDCVKCHHGEFSRPFDYAQFWPRVQHAREPGPAATR